MYTLVKGLPQGFIAGIVILRYAKTATTVFIKAKASGTRNALSVENLIWTKALIPVSDGSWGLINPPMVRRWELDLVQVLPGR